MSQAQACSVGRMKRGVEASIGYMSFCVSFIYLMSGINFIVKVFTLSMKHLQVK